MFVVLNLDIGIDPKAKGNIKARSIGARDSERHILSGTDTFSALKSSNGEFLSSRETQRLSVLTLYKLEWKNAHPD